MSWDNIVRLKPISDKVINFTRGLGPPNLRFLNVMGDPGYESDTTLKFLGVGINSTTKTTKKGYYIDLAVVVY